MQEAINFLQQGEVDKSEAVFSEIIEQSTNPQTLSTAYYNRAFVRLFVYGISDFEGVEKALEYEHCKDSYLLKSLLYLRGNTRKDIKEANLACCLGLIYGPQCGVGIYLRYRISFLEYCGIYPIYKSAEDDFKFPPQDITLRDLQTVKSKLQVSNNLLGIKSEDLRAVLWFCKNHRTNNHDVFTKFFIYWMTHYHTVNIRIQYLKELLNLKKYEEVVEILTGFVDEKGISANEMELLAEISAQIMESHPHSIVKMTKIFAHFVKGQAIREISESLDETHLEAIAEAAKPTLTTSISGMSTSSTEYLPLNLVLSRGLP
jgi:hypothetical protein